MQNEPLILLVDQRRGSEVLGIYLSGVIEVYVLHELEIRFQKQSYFRGMGFFAYLTRDSKQIEFVFLGENCLKDKFTYAYFSLMIYCLYIFFSFHIQELDLKPYTNKTRPSSSQPNYHFRLLLLSHLIMFSSTICIYINTKGIKYFKSVLCI